MVILMRFYFLTNFKIFVSKLWGTKKKLKKTEDFILNKIKGNIHNFKENKILFIKKNKLFKKKNHIFYTYSMV